MKPEQEQQQAEEKGEKRDMATLMSGVMNRLASKLDCAMDTELPTTFLKIVPSCSHIPLFDAAKMALVQFTPTVLEKAGELESVLARYGFGEDDARIVDEVRRSLQLEMETNRMLKRTPKYYPMALCLADEIPFLRTEMDATVRGLIYTLATQMPSQEPMKLQHAYYGFLVAYLFQQLPLSEHSEVRYAYLITEGNRLNLFMSVVR